MALGALARRVWRGCGRVPSFWAIMVRASFELPTAQAPLLSSPLPQTAEATPHFARQTRGNVCIMSWRRAVPLGSTDKTYHEPLTYAMPREGYTRLPRAYISRWSSSSSWSRSILIHIRSILNSIAYQSKWPPSIVQPLQRPPVSYTSLEQHLSSPLSKPEDTRVQQKAEQL